MWKEILFRVLAGDKEIPSPFHPRGIMKSLFVIVVNETREGFLWIWCSETLKGINISRMTIPENIQAVYVDKISSMDIPQIEFEDPGKIGGGL